MDKQQKWIASVLSILCIGIIILRHLWSGLILDEKIIFFFGLGALPWLVAFF